LRLAPKDTVHGTPSGAAADREDECSSHSAARSGIFRLVSRFEVAGCTDRPRCCHRSDVTLCLQFRESVLRASEAPLSGGFVTEKSVKLRTVGNDMLGDRDLSTIRDSECLLLLNEFDDANNRNPGPLRRILLRAELPRVLTRFAQLSEFLVRCALIQRPD